MEIKEDNQAENKEDSALPSLIEMVNRLEKANKEGQEILRRQEELIARNLIGGKSDGGQIPNDIKPETPREYTARVLRGG